MTTLDNELTRKAVIHWMDTMKERLDHYEVHRNEFLSDMRLPPRNVKFLREVLLPFCENTLLLDNIAKSEGLCYMPNGKENRLRIVTRIDGKEVLTTYPELKTIEDDRTQVCYPDSFPYLLQHQKYNPATTNENTLSDGLNAREPKAGDKDPDFEICLPSEHAFYSILENVIRNSAKHNAGNIPAEGLRIFIDICGDSSDPDHYHCTIYDNVSRMPLISADEGKMDLRRMMGKKDERLLHDGRPTRANMGMADMKINAFLLQSGNDFKEEDLNKALDMVVVMEEERKSCSPERFRLLRVVDGDVQFVKQLARKDPLRQEELEAPSDNKGKDYRFGYRFKLTKAKKVAWIGKAPEGNEEEYKRAGVYHFAPSKNDNTGWEAYTASLSNTLAAYEIAVLEDAVWQALNEDSGKTLRAKLSMLPFRVLVNSSELADIESPFDRRAVVASLKCTDKDDLLLSALSVWVKGKYKQPLLVRGYWGHELPVQENDPYTWQHEEEGCKVIDMELHTKTVAQSKQRAICGPDDRLWVIDHHGSLAQAYKYPDANGKDKEKVFLASKCLDRAYTFSAKVNPDHDPMSAVLKEIDKRPVEFVSMVDRAHRRIVIVDERLAEMVAGKDNPHSDFKIRPNDLWAVFAAMNIYVVTQLCIDGDTSFGFETSRRSSLRFFQPASGVGAFDWVVSEDMAISNTDLYPVLDRTDILVMHRTHWLKFKSKELDAMLLNRFGDVIITSGAGVAEELRDLKHLSFATLMSFLRSSIASKFRLAQTLDGLTVKPHKQ